MRRTSGSLRALPVRPSASSTVKPPRQWSAVPVLGEAMSIAAHTFDRLTYIDRLKEAGVDERQARAHADALDAAFRDTVATEADLEDVKRQLEAKIETSSANLKVDILRWLVVTQLALAGLLLAAIKFVK
jgi:hypothetical protein